MDIKLDDSFKIIENPSKEFIENHINDGECIEDFTFRFMRRNSSVLIDTISDKIAGIYMIYNEKEYDGHNVLNDFEITPNYRGKGLSYQLLDHAVKIKGANHLWVNEDNEIAKHLYLKYGFEFTGEKKSVIEIDKTRHIRLYMELKGE